MDTRTNPSCTPEDATQSEARPARPWLLLNRAFALLWSAQTVSYFGSYITSIGLPLIALLLLHASPAQMGMLAALEALPGLFLGLMIGVWVDRLPRRPILLIADVGRAALLALIPLTAALGILHLSWLYLVATLTGLLTVSFEVASLSFLPSLLPTDELAAGNSRLGTSASLAEVAGPPLAGLLISLLTAPVAIMLDMLSFVFSATCIGLMRVAERSQPAQTTRARLWQEIGGGLSIAWKHPVLRALAGYICTHSFFGGAYVALYLLYIVQLFGKNPLTYGVLIAMGGVGALAGSLCAGVIARRAGLGKTLTWCVLLFGIIAFSTPLALGPQPVAFTIMAAGQLIGDFWFAIFSINEISLRQTLVPDQALGRVNACMHVLSNGIIPLGALFFGVIGQLLGLRWTLLIGSSGICLSAAWLIFSPLRQLEKISR